MSCCPEIETKTTYSDTIDTIESSIFITWDTIKYQDIDTTIFVSPYSQKEYRYYKIIFSKIDTSIMKMSVSFDGKNWKTIN